MFNRQLYTSIRYLGMITVFYLFWVLYRENDSKQLYNYADRTNMKVAYSSITLKPDCFKKYDILQDVPINSLQFTDEQKQFFKEREEIYMTRKNKVKEICESLHGLGNHQDVNDMKFGRYYVGWVPKKGIAVCFNPKVASTTWKLNLLRSEYPGIKDAPIGLLDPPFKDKSESFDLITNCLIKIMFVRHPFSRLVSAYKDKLAFPGRIVDKRVINSDGSSPTFRQFVEHVVRTTPVHAKSIKELIKNTTNMHWQHFYSFCSVCDFHYDIIGYMETSNEDTRYIAERFGLNIDLNFKVNRNKTSSELDAINFFKDIPRSMILKLYEIYKVDFQMFGYTPDAYLSSKDDA